MILIPNDQLSGLREYYDTNTGIRLHTVLVFHHDDCVSDRRLATLRFNLTNHCSCSRVSSGRRLQNCRSQLQREHRGIRCQLSNLARNVTTFPHARGFVRVWWGVSDLTSLVFDCHTIRLCLSFLSGPKKMSRPQQNDVEIVLD